MKGRQKIIWLLGIVTFTLFGSPAAAATATPNIRDVRSQFGSLNIPFIENQGQYARDISFHAATFVGDVFITGQGRLVYQLPCRKMDEQKAVSLSEVFKGAKTPVVKGLAASACRVNDFRGNSPTRWRSRIATYETVSLGEIYAGIEVMLRAHGDNMEKLFHVQPGADPAAIRIQVRGAESIRTLPDGRLAVATPYGRLTLTRPVAYQEVDGRKTYVDVAYRVAGDTYAFALADYDHGLPLLIDPLFSTYLGGSGRDYIHALKTNTVSDGETSQLYVYVAGYTTSTTDFPGLTGFQTSPGWGGQDAFVARLDMDLKVLDTTFIGGSGEDTAWDLAISTETDNVYVVGTTDSDDFPTAPLPGRGRGGAKDGFVACLSADLATLEQSRYLGGSDIDDAIGIDIHLRPEPDLDSLYVVGRTISADFPATEGAAQPAHGPDRPLSDGFVARLDPDDLSLRRASYLGGSSTDSAHAVDVDDVTHEVFVTGSTSYNGRESDIWQGTFPWVDPDDFGGQVDAFVVRLSEDLSTALNATYVGGSGIESGLDLAVNHSTHKVYVVGSLSPYLISTSPLVYANDLPGVAGGFQTELAGGQEGFVARLSTDLVIENATYLGGSNFDRAADVLLSDPGAPSFDVYVLGWTESADLPGTTGGYCAPKGRDEVFVARLNQDLTSLYQATYLSGTGDDEVLLRGLDMAHDPHSGALYLFAAGDTSSTDFPGVLHTATDAAAQPVSGGSMDAWVARLDPLLTPIGPADIELQPRSHDFGNHHLGIASPPLSINFENMGGEALEVSSVFLRGEDMVDYTLNFDAGTHPCGSPPFTVATGELCTANVVFTASVDNDLRTAEVVVQSANDPDEPELVIPLQGYSGPDIDLQPAVTGHEPAINFPMTQIGSTTPQSFTIQNVGFSDLTVTDIQKTGIAPDTGADFTLRYEGVGACPDPAYGDFTLTPGAICTVMVDFAPTFAATQEGLVIIHSNDLDESPAFMHLIGPGVAELTANIWSHDLAFHDVPTGSAYSLPLVVSNTGGQPLQITQYTLSDTTNFSIDTSGGAVPCASVGGLLAPTDYCTLTATFRPQADGTFDETLTFGSNDPDEPNYPVHFTGRSGLDSDGDYVLDIEEPGDANNDTIADANQADVAALHSMEGNHYVIFEALDGAELRDVRPQNSPSDAPLAGYAFPFGFYRFRILLPASHNGATIRLTVLNADSTPADPVDTYVKYGPEPGAAGYHYYDLGQYTGPVDINGTSYPDYVETAGNVITLHLVDGGAGDSDDADGDGRGEVNHEILDPGAPAQITAVVDSDGDGVPDSSDNCPAVSNAGQADADSDGIGDPCDACPNDADNDHDGDTVCGDVDNCPDTANTSQVDTDGDGIGDACETVGPAGGSGTVSGGGGSSSGCFISGLFF